MLTVDSSPLPQYLICFSSSLSRDEAFDLPFISIKKTFLKIF